MSEASRMAALAAVGAVVFALILASMTPPAQAQAENAGFQAAKGRVSFRLYCASCHGVEGQGDGNVAKFLKVKPANLTLLKQKYDGRLPEERLYRVIDGREEVATHGDREMPVWGDVFQDPISDSQRSEESSQARVDRKIGELIMFLRTIQVETAEATAGDG